MYRFNKVQLENLNYRLWNQNRVQKANHKVMSKLRLIVVRRVVFHLTDSFGFIYHQLLL